MHAPQVSCLHGIDLHSKIGGHPIVFHSCVCGVAQTDNELPLAWFVVLQFTAVLKPHQSCEQRLACTLLLMQY
jgi:hypothetical protein